MKVSALFKTFFALSCVFAILSATESSAQESVSDSWSFKIIGTDSSPQQFTVSNQTFQVSAPKSETSQMAFTFLPLKANGQIAARISEMPDDGLAQSGLMIRESLSNEARYVRIFLASNNIIFERRLEPGHKVFRTVETNILIARNLRLIREGDAFSGFYSSDGTNWVQISADTIFMGNEILVGIASQGGESVFDQVGVMGARIASPPDNSAFVVPTNILFETKIETYAETPRKVEFFSGAEKIGESMLPPFKMFWTNAFAGVQSLTAKITGVSGTELFTEPVTCEIKLGASKANFIREDVETRGAWAEKYGTDGFHVFFYSTNYPSYAQVSSSGHKRILLTHSKEPGALKFTNSNWGIVGQWFTYSNMTVNVNLLDGRWHQVAVYFHDWDSNRRVEQVELIDSSTGAILDKRRVAGFHPGKYLIWNIRGAVKFRITAVTGNAVISAIFFDPPSAQTPP